MYALVYVFSGTLNYVKKNSKTEISEILSFDVRLIFREKNITKNAILL